MKWPKIEKFNYWKTLMGVITATAAVIALVIGFADDVDNKLHVAPIEKLKAFVIAQNQAQDNKSELTQLKAERRDLNSRIRDHEQRQSNIWSRSVLTNAETRTLKIIDRTLRDLKADRREINNRIREIEK